MNLIELKLTRGKGKSAEELVVQFPSQSVLLQEALRLQKQSAGTRIEFAALTDSCIAIYTPPRVYTTTDVDVFTGRRGDTQEHQLHDYCQFFFWDGALTFAAMVKFDTEPAAVRMAVDSANETCQETADARRLLEGAPIEVQLSTYERNPALRLACIRHHGSKCAACGMEFGRVYGPIANGIIHVHHRHPLSRTRGVRHVDPVKDLVPLCANCHAVAHLQDPPLEPHQIAELLQGDVWHAHAQRGHR